jgi:hypothetical protein
VARKKLKKGTARMMELGRVKIEVWLSEGQAGEFKKLAASLGLRPATLARRALYYITRGGKESARVLQNNMYD